MERRLEIGTRVELGSGARPGSVARRIGAGGQGAVYALDLDGREMALKWYHPHVVAADPRLRERVGRAVARGAPDAGFLWPLDLADIRGEASFGYLMAMRPDGFSSLHDLIAAPPHRIDPPLAVRATIGLNVAESFLRLHARGLCYRDVSLGNVFADPQTGAIRIGDNDNVDVDGSPPVVYGTRKFMAPEVLRREKFPDARTDLYSMAVLFFYILLSWHPLDGRREKALETVDAAAELDLYGNAPRFLFDPADASNGPVPGFHDPIARRWRALNGRLRALFARAFGPGLDPRAPRVMETEWRGALAALRDAVVRCPACAYEHALDAEDADARPEVFGCVHCGRVIAVPPRLAVNRSVVLLDEAASLYPHHLDPERPFDFSRSVARVEPRPGEPSTLGLRNGGTEPWTARLLDGRTVVLPPGRTLRLVNGMRLDFGRTCGKVSF